MPRAAPPRSATPPPRPRSPASCRSSSPTRCSPSRSTCSGCERRMPLIAVEHLDVGYGRSVLQRDVSFEIDAGEIFIVMGASGSGKSTLLKHMVGLLEPSRGDVRFAGTPFWASDEARQQAIRRRLGVLF